MCQKKPTKMLYFLGIDGGGTKTEFVLQNADGETCASCILAASNPADIGIQQSEAVLRDGIETVCAGIPYSEIYLFAGIAGAISTGSREAMAGFFSSFGFTGYGYASDNDNIIAAGLKNGDGITMIIGTGVCAFTVRAGQRKRTAGWGYLIDRGGSAYNIGADALRAYYMALDGTGPATSLSEAVEARSGLSPDVLLGKIYADGKRYIASFAPVVFREAEKGDEAAREIISRNASCAAGFLSAAAEPFRDDGSAVLPIVLAGGLTNEPAFLTALKTAAEPLLRQVLPETECRITVLPCRPVDGALLRARELSETEDRRASPCRNTENI